MPIKIHETSRGREKVRIYGQFCAANSLQEPLSHTLFNANWDISDADYDYLIDQYWHQYNILFAIIVIEMNLKIMIEMTLTNYNDMRKIKPNVFGHEPKLFWQADYYITKQ